MPISGGSPSICCGPPRSANAGSKSRRLCRSQRRPLFRPPYAHRQGYRPLHHAPAARGDLSVPDETPATPRRARRNRSMKAARHHGLPRRAFGYPDLVGTGSRQGSSSTDPAPSGSVNRPLVKGRSRAPTSASRSQQFRQRHSASLDFDYVFVNCDLTINLFRRRRGHGSASIGELVWRRWLRSGGVRALRCGGGEDPATLGSHAQPSKSQFASFVLCARRTTIVEPFQLGVTFNRARP